MLEFPILSFLTWLPIAGGVLVLLFGDRGIRAGRWVALAIALATFAASIPLYTHFNPGTFELQFKEQLPWIPAHQIASGVTASPPFWRRHRSFWRRDGCSCRPA